MAGRRKKRRPAVVQPVQTELAGMPQPKDLWNYRGEFGVKLGDPDNVGFEGQVEADTLEAALSQIQDKLAQRGPDAFLKEIVGEFD